MVFGYKFRWHSRSLEKASPMAEHLPRDIVEVARRRTQYGVPFTRGQTMANQYVGNQGIDPQTDLEDQFEKAVA